MSWSGTQMRRLLSDRSAKRSPLPSITPPRPGGAQGLEPGGIRQILHRVVVEADHLADVDRRILDVLVLAELAVDHDQVVELEAVQRLDLRRRRRSGRPSRS